MCNSGDNGKTRYFFGPFEDPADGPRVLMSLETAIEDLTMRFNGDGGEVGDVLEYKIVELTEAEVEALPDM